MQEQRLSTRFCSKWWISRASTEWNETGRLDLRTSLQVHYQSDEMPRNKFIPNQFRVIYRIDPSILSETIQQFRPSFRFLLYKNSSKAQISPAIFICCCSESGTLLDSERCSELSLDAFCESMEDALQSLFIRVSRELLPSEQCGLFWD